MGITVSSVPYVTVGVKFWDWCEKTATGTLLYNILIAPCAHESKRS